MRGSFVCLIFAAAAVAMCLAFSAFATLAEKDLEGYTFEMYVKEFGKEYKDLDEYKMRREVFHANLANVIAFNTRPSRSYTMGINHFSDLTREEVNARYNGHRPTYTSSGLPRIQYYASTAETSLPDSFSWLDAKNPVLTAVKKQSECGSCWAFSAVESIESMHAIQTGELLSLSTQQVTSCTKNPKKCGGTGGCKGATPQLAWDYVKEIGGITLESDYPYINFDSITRECIFNSAMPLKVSVSGHVTLPHNDAQAVMYALVNYGPLVVSVDSSEWAQYSGGIFDSCGSKGANITINHAVLLVGYGTDSKTGQDYWHLRNSWGTDWGEGGYIRLLRNKAKEPCVYNNDWNTEGGGCADDPEVTITACGMCGVLYEVSYPTVTEVGVRVVGSCGFLVLLVLFLVEFLL